MVEHLAKQSCKQSVSALGMTLDDQENNTRKPCKIKNKALTRGAAIILATF